VQEEAVLGTVVSRAGGATSEASLKSRKGWATIAAIAAVALVLHHDIGLFAIASADHDDALFFRIASEIQRGRWLGAYNQMTLAKGPMLSILVAGTSAVGAPIKSVEFVVYLMAAAG
jgi:hypothetical protein